MSKYDTPLKNLIQRDDFLYCFVRSLINLTNEYAEKNRLKRLELSYSQHIQNIPDVELTDQA